MAGAEMNHNGQPGISNLEVKVSVLISHSYHPWSENWTLLIVNRENAFFFVTENLGLLMSCTLLMNKNVVSLRHVI